MTAPLSDARLTEIRERARRMIADHVTYAPVQYAEDYSVMLAEIDRLHTLVADLERTVRYFDEQSKRRKTERDQARAELATTHADALNRGAAVLDRLADAAEAKVLAHYNGACGNGSCDLVRESARTLREMAAKFATPTA